MKRRNFCVGRKRRRGLAGAVKLAWLFERACLDWESCCCCCFCCRCCSSFSCVASFQERRCWVTVLPLARTDYTNNTTPTAKFKSQTFFFIIITFFQIYFSTCQLLHFLFYQGGPCLSSKGLENISFLIISFLDTSFKISLVNYKKFLLLAYATSMS